MRAISKISSGLAGTKIIGTFQQGYVQGQLMKYYFKWANTNIYFTFQQGFLKTIDEIQPKLASNEL